MTSSRGPVSSIDPCLDKQILSTFGHLSLADVTPATVRMWFGSYGSKTPAYRARAYQVLRAIFETAVSDELIVANLQGQGRWHARAGQEGRARHAGPDPGAHRGHACQTRSGGSFGIVLCTAVWRDERAAPQGHRPASGRSAYPPWRRPCWSPGLHCRPAKVGRRHPRRRRTAAPDPDDQGPSQDL